MYLGDLSEKEKSNIILAVNLLTPDKNTTIINAFAETIEPYNNKKSKAADYISALPKKIKSREKEKLMDAFIVLNLHNLKNFTKLEIENFLTLSSSDKKNLKLYNNDIDKKIDIYNKTNTDFTDIIKTTLSLLELNPNTTKLSQSDLNAYLLDRIFFYKEFESYSDYELKKIKEAYMFLTFLISE